MKNKKIISEEFNENNLSSNVNENNKTKKIVMAAMLAALTCVATMIIKIPSPLKGYLNLGDCIVLTAGWMLSPTYGFLAAGIGSALADLFSGYVIYAPATFIIKGVMALIAFYGFKLLHNKIGDFSSQIISGIIAEAVIAATAIKGSLILIRMLS